MKRTFITIAASIATALSAAASPALCIKVTITASADHIVSRPTVFVESGKQAIIATNSGGSALTYALTPTLLDNGTVAIQSVITQSKGEKTDTLGTSRIIVQLDKVAEVQVGQLVFALKPSLTN